MITISPWRLIIITLTLLSISIASSAPLASATPGAKDIHAQLKVGIILPLSGDFGPIANEIRKGIEFRHEALARAGIEVVYEDDRFERKSAVSAFRKLTAVDGVKLILSSVAPVMEPLIPLAESAKVPVVAMWDFNDKIHRPEGFSFSIGFSNPHAGIQLGQFSCNNLKLKSAAVVATEDEWGEVISSNFAKRFAECGGRIAYQQAVSFDHNDLSTIVTQIKARKPDGVIFPLYGPSFFSLLRQAKAQQLDAVLITGEGVFPEDDKKLGDLLDDVYFQRIWVSDEEFKRAFKGETPSGSRGFRAMGYDAAEFLLALQEALGGTELTATRVRDEIARLRFTGITGEVNLAHFRGKSLTILRRALVENSPIYEELQVK